MAPRTGSSSAVEVGFPFKINNYGRISDPDYELHVQQMIELLLFTTPGERVNRPDFGCGLLQLVFGPDTETVGSTVEYLVRTALQRWMSDVIAVRGVTVEARAGALRIKLAYTLILDQKAGEVVFEAPARP
jgi:hypothetical protein